MPVFVVCALLAQRVLLSSRDSVGVHAAENLASASAPFMAAAVVAILVWTTPQARHQIDVLVAAAVWFTTTVSVMVGNLRVIEDLVAAGYSQTRTGSVPDVADHALANSSIWYAVVVALAHLVPLAPTYRQPRSNRRSDRHGCLSAVDPPSAGVIVLTIVR